MSTSRAAPIRFGRARQLAQLGVVEDQAVDVLDRPHEVLAGGVDPQVHRVERDEARVGQLAAHVELQLRLDVRQEQHVAGARALGQLRAEPLEHAELRVERLPGVEVPAVLAAPEEGPPSGDALDVRDVDAAAAHHVELGLAEVLPDRTDHAHLVEERCGQREVDGRAAEHPLALPERRLDGVEGDRSNHRDRHRRAP